MESAENESRRLLGWLIILRLFALALVLGGILAMREGAGGDPSRAPTDEEMEPHSYLGLACGVALAACAVAASMIGNRYAQSCKQSDQVVDRYYWFLTPFVFYGEDVALEAVFILYLSLTQILLGHAGPFRLQWLVIGMIVLLIYVSWQGRTSRRTK